jgi:hypothetical protein
MLPDEDVPGLQPAGRLVVRGAGGAVDHDVLLIDILITGGVLDRLVIVVAVESRGPGDEQEAAEEEGEGRAAHVTHSPSTTVR